MSKRHVVAALTQAHIDFIQRYMIRNNAERAYQDSHPNASWASCRTAGARLLKDVRIRSQINALRSEQRKRLAHKGQDVVDELAKLGFGNLSDVFTAEGTLIPPMDMPREIAAAVKKVKRTEILGAVDPETNRRAILGHTVELEMHDKVGPLKLLGQRLGVLEAEAKAPSIKDFASILEAAGQRVIDAEKARRLGEKVIEGERVG